MAGYAAGGGGRKGGRIVEHVCANIVISVCLRHTYDTSFLSRDRFTCPHGYTAYLETMWEGRGLKNLLLLLENRFSVEGVT